MNFKVIARELKLRCFQFCVYVQLTSEGALELGCLRTLNIVCWWNEDILRFIAKLLSYFMIKIVQFVYNKTFNAQKYKKNGFELILVQFFSYFQTESDISLDTSQSTVIPDLRNPKMLLIMKQIYLKPNYNIIYACF